jgi:hypothetical protein
MLPMLIIFLKMSIVKQHDKKDNVCQRTYDISQLFKINSLKNIIKNVFNIYLHHNPIKV